MTEDKQPVWVHCEACDHEWILFYVPIAVAAMRKFMKNPCQMCGESKQIQMGAKPKITPPERDVGKPATQRVMEWLASGDTGISSESLAFEFLDIERKWHFVIGQPHDPADLGRCLRLIARVPEVRGSVDSLATKHKGWAKLATAWDEIAALMAEEVGIDWSKGRSAPKTYDLMKRVAA